jgi:acetolactate synthase-1/2/3 large subunit
MRLLKAHFANSILPGRSLGAMGQATAGAIGAKLACPDKPVIVITGDGSFLMQGTEVVAAINLNLPVIWIVVNDRSLNRIYSAQKLDFGGRVIATTLPNIDFARVAEGLGLWSVRITKFSELVSAMQQALANHGPSLLDIVVSREVAPPV